MRPAHAVAVMGRYKKPDYNLTTENRNYYISNKEKDGTCRFRVDSYGEGWREDESYAFPIGYPDEDVFGFFTKKE